MELGTFDVVQIDPPWSLITGSQSRTQHRRGVQLSYDLLTVEEIKALPIASLVPNGFVLLWFIQCHMAAAQDLL
jgi:N6-adenosine-specific RNA methylase IME4